MLDIAVAYNRYKFLGNEFLTWLWFMIETDQNRLRQYDPDLVSFNVGSRLVLENTRNNAKETVTIKGESLNISNLKLPETGPVETPEDLEGVIIEKAYLLEKVIRLVNNLFVRFIKLRVSNEWRNQTVSRIRKWAAS